MYRQIQWKNTRQSEERGRIPPLTDRVAVNVGLFTSHFISSRGFNFSLLSKRTNTHEGEFSWTKNLQALLEITSFFFRRLTQAKSNSAKLHRHSAWSQCSRSYPPRGLSSSFHLIMVIVRLPITLLWPEFGSPRPLWMDHPIDRPLTMRVWLIAPKQLAISEPYSL